VENQASFSGWAKVEVMGHQSHIGFVRTEAYGQAVMFRVDMPEFPEREFVLEEPAYVDGKWTPKGAKVLRPAMPGASVLVGAGSIYRIAPCSEAAALKAIEQEFRPELRLIELPAVMAIAAGASTELRDFTCCDGNPESGHEFDCPTLEEEDQNDDEDDEDEDCEARL
jgi:hypothetical protein